jgi:hypothetical protein
MKKTNAQKTLKNYKAVGYTGISILLVGSFL